MAEDRFARGGIVHGPGATDNDLAGMWPLGAVASAQMARESLQGIRDAIDSAAEKGLAYRDARLTYGQFFSLDLCHNCSRTIRVMINRGTGWCSEQCRKRLAGEWEADE